MNKVAIAVISLAVGAIVGPYINWGIEKRKQKLTYQRGLIANWRTMLVEIQNEGMSETSLGELLSKHPSWPSLVPYLPKAAVSTLGVNWSSPIVVEGRIYPPTQAVIYSLMNDIGNIEKKWKLIQ